MRILYTILLLTIVSSSYSQCTQLAWADEFNGSSLDLTKWAPQNGNGCPDLCGWGNGELQSYTTDYENIKIENGNLVITAVRENSIESPFTSSKLRTLGLHSWIYGRFEARMRMPLGAGLWPAFWMLNDNNNWPMTGEIDIMEYRGDKPTETHGTLHYGSVWPNNQWDGNVHTHSASLADDFHVYAVEWEENEIRWYFDDVMFKRETKDPNSLNPPSTNNTWPWDSDFYLILNLAVGGGFTGNPSAEQVQLSKPTFEIDYVRIYNGALSDQLSISGPSKILTSEPATFSVPEIPGASYNWNVGNATVLSGKDSREIQLSWNSEQHTKVSVIISGSECEDQNTELVKDVKVVRIPCNQVYNNFDDIEETTLAYSTGIYEKVNNPASNAINNSTTALRYTRSPGAQYDVLFMDEVLFMNGNLYENEEFGFEMDIYTTMPAGTRVELQIASIDNWQNAWPAGRHTVYAATTSTPGAWETLRFSFAESGDPIRASFQNTLDRMILLFNPNTYTGDVYYIDNLRQVPIQTTSCTITGLQKAHSFEFNIYPIPADNMLTIELNDMREIVSANLVDSKGHTLKEFAIHGKYSLDISSYSPGIYLLRISDPTGSSVIQKIVIK